MLRRHAARRATFAPRPRACITPMDAILAWAMAHPLHAVGVLVAVSAVTCLLLAPALWEAMRHGSPRC